MLLSEIRSHIRSVVDLDSTELTDTFLDVLCREASDEILSRARAWPDFEQAWTFATVAGTQTYTLSSIEPATTDVADIISIVDTTSGGCALQPVDHAFAEVAWRNSLLVSSQPTHWSEWGNVLYLWPKPNTIRTMAVRSYRKPKDWVADGASGTPDMDSRLHSAIALYALVRVYEFQEDPQLAAQYRELFENHVGRVMREIFRTPSRPLILNNGLGFYRSEDQWLRSLGKVAWP